MRVERNIERTLQNHGGDTNVARGSNQSGCSWYDGGLSPQARLPFRLSSASAVSTASAALPSQVHVFVRDWLSSNNILLKSREGHVLIDSGYVRHAPLTLALLGTERGLGDGPLARLVNTHCHSDHMGGNAAIKERYGCPIELPIGEAPLIDAWDEQTLLLDYTDQYAPRFAYDATIRPGESRIWGDLEWRALAAPGHDMAALVFFNSEHGILISGDALWENGYGLVMPKEIDPRALPATRATLEMIATLDVRVVIPGHGEPFTHVRPALERAFARTAAFEADPLRIARHALKVILTFALLDRRRLKLADMPAYLERVGIYRHFNTLFFRLPASDLAGLLIGELERVGAARREAGWLLPA
jgi:glyoxylase-like metal-dependent hydrolase (beta-lactamase superfamily II)